MLNFIFAIASLAAVAYGGWWSWNRSFSEGRWKLPAWVAAIAGTVGLFQDGIHGFMLWGGVAGIVTCLALIAWPRGVRIRSNEATATADINEDVEALQALQEGFNPEEYIDLERGIFLGLEDFQRIPKYVPQHAFSGSHASILGISGTGKSSFVGVLLSQLAGAGEGVIVFDPKPDQMLPRVLMRSAERFGVPFHFINLNTPTEQINPFLGCTSAEVDDLLQAALGLGVTGNAAVDFYRGKDREASGYLADATAGKPTSLPSLISLGAADERVTEQENLWRELRAIGKVKAACAPAGTGLDLREIIQGGGVLYVAGSSTDLKIAAVQKMLLQRVMQILQTREDDSRPVALFLDELKYLLSPGALRAASQIRSYNSHCVFAYQSLEDLNDCPSLDPKAVFGAVYGNSTVKIVYRVPDVRSAREFEAAGGKVRRQEVTGSRSDNGETVTASQQWKWVEVPKFKEHVFTHLPRPRKGHPDASVGIVFGVDSTAFICATRWLPAGEEPPRIVPVEMTAAAAPAEQAVAAAVPEVDPFADTAGDKPQAAENTVSGHGATLDEDDPFAG